MTPAVLSRVLLLASFIVSSVGYGVAEGNLALCALVLPAGALGWYLTELRGIYPMTRVMINTLLVAVIAWTGYRVLSEGSGRGLTVSMFCEFLSMILVVKLWERRSARDAAQVFTLASFLSIGSVLTGTSLLVAVLLLLNVIVLTLGVMAFHVASGEERAARAASEVGIDPPPPAPVGRAAARSLVRTAVGVLLPGLIISFAVWLIMPRGSGLGELGRLGEIGSRRSGFTDRVDLRRSGLISESQRAVMEVRVTDDRDENVGSDGQVFYLRGAVLDAYERAAWTSSGGRRREDTLQMAPDKVVHLSERSPRGTRITQRIRVREMVPGPAALMASAVPVSVTFAQEGRLQFNRETQELGRTGRPGGVEYTVVSAPPVRRTDAEPLTRAQGISFPSEAVRLFADGVLKQAGVEPDPQRRLVRDDLTACRAIESHLRRNFEYTLDTPVLPADSEPLEEFLLRTRRGHCEFFASAMAALCRSAGINARVVAGYLAAEFDSEAEAYLVRESHAHAWVEAEVAPRVWLTFDPTPPTQIQLQANPSLSLAARLARVLDGLDSAWSRSVVSFDESSRRKVLGFDFNPTERIQDYMMSLYARARNEGPRAWVRLFASALMVAAAVAAAVGVLSVAFRFIAAWLHARAARSAGRLPPVVVEQGKFYEELLAVLTRRGMGKPIWSPPLSHAREIDTVDPAAADALRIAGLAYYKLRFANSKLSEAELESARSAVRRLKQSPKQNRHA